MVSKTIINLVPKFVKRFVKKSIKNTLSNQHAVIVYYNDSYRAKIFDLIKKIKGETEFLLEDNEAYQVYMAVKATKKLKGDIAEVGVYKGGSAKLICEAESNKKIYLFDTFEGLPAVDKVDDLFYEGQYRAAFEEVKEYLGMYDNVSIFKGDFYDTSKYISTKRFSFVNLDVDLYSSTANCLNFFYPRMVAGGIIMSDNYIDAEGVRQAFDKFFKDKPEVIIELSGTQCLVVKL